MMATPWSPTKQQIVIQNTNIASTLVDLNIQVSTGPIVDFRHKDLLQKDFEEHTIPIIYAVHLKNHRLSWPQIQRNQMPSLILK